MGVAAAALYTGRIYPGLRPFEAADALLFFGRDKQIDELLRRLEDTRFLGVVGLSGSGKSSLVRAGLLPALQRGHLTAAGSQWRLAVMRPGGDPLGALARVLNETLGPHENRPATLRSSSLGLIDAASQGRKADENLLLVVDQFEELFRFQDSDHIKAAEAAEFVDLLLAATRDFEPLYRIYIVITLRSDYLGECARFEGLPEALNESQYLVPRMTNQQLREAIEGPAALGGVELNSDLLQELLDKTGDDPDQLPVLQHLLMRMWEIRERDGAHSRIGAEQYEKVGRWENAVNSHADKVWKDLADQQELGKRIFQRLTEKRQAGHEVRRPATLLELARVAAVTPDAVKKIVEHFREEGCNFLTSPDQSLTDNSVIDISHESLIRRWNALNDWATEEADSGEWYRRLEDRIAIGAAFIADPELESALQAREKGRWNEAWAARYTTAKVPYPDVIRFLDSSKQRRTDELARARRNQIAVAIAAIVFAGLSAFAGYSYFSAKKAQGQALESARSALEQKVEALEQRVKAEKALQDLRTESARTEAARALAVQNAKEAVQETNVAIARQLASESVLERTGSDTVDHTVPALLGVESLLAADTVEGYEALWSASRLMARQMARLVHQGEVHAVAFSPDGKLLATASEDRTARIFEVRTGRELARLAHEDRVLAVTFSPDGRLFATSPARREARVFDTQTMREVARAQHSDPGGVIAFSPDGRLLATGSYNEARVLEARTGHEVAVLPHHGPVDAITFSPDGTLLATGSRDHTARVFDARTWLERVRLEHEAGVNAVAFNPQGTLVAAASWDNIARVFEARTGREVARLPHRSWVDTVAFSHDGNLLATGSWDHTARVFWTQSWKELSQLPHQSNVNAVAFSPDDKLLVTASTDKTARLFDVLSGREMVRLAHQGAANAVAFSPDGRVVASGSDDKTARLFDVKAERKLPRLAYRGFLSTIAFSSDGTWIATGSTDHTARVFESRTGLQVAELAHRGAVVDVTFSRDGTLLATASWDHTAGLFEARTGRELASFEHPSDVKAVAFSPDGALLATGSGDKMARVFELRTKRTIAQLTHQGEVRAVAFSPDGKLLAAGSDDKTARVFETRTWRELAGFAHQGEVLRLAFSPDGTLLVTGSADKTARVFDLRTRRELARLAHQDEVGAVAFSPDSKLVATGSDDQTARVFEARTGREIARLPLAEGEVIHVDFVNRGRDLRVVTSDLRVVTRGASLPGALYPVFASDLIADACSKLDRNLTPDEWKTYLGNTPCRKTCERLNPTTQPPKK
jgi:WD40 repeat protein/energy-coupling factor transporter ATP-binding protein EcfA2